MLAVIGVTAAVTISVTSGDGGGDDPAPPQETYGLASAGDTGPVNIITEDPSCAAWRPINDTFAAAQKRGWNRRDPQIPADQWTPDQRDQYIEVADAARRAADQTVPLAKLTPHRVLREIYEQFIAYARAYSEVVPSYEPRDDHLARVVTSTGAAVVYLCAAIEHGSAEARAPLISEPAKPSALAPIVDPESPEPMMTTPDPICDDWSSALNQFNAGTKDWQSLDSALSASEWTPEQRSIVDEVIPKMDDFANRIQEIGQRSGNPIVRDIAMLAAQYRRGYAAALPTYTPADSFLTSTSRNAASAIYEACNAAE